MSDYFDLLDECLTMYYLQLAISLFCGGLYSWWWYRSHREGMPASDVFKWLTILFYAQAIRLTGNIIVRSDYVLRHPVLGEKMGFMTDSYLWTFRNFPELLVLIYMLSLILGRLYCNVPRHKCLSHD